MTNNGRRARASGRPTLEQVAIEANVSRGTASRVVNGSLEVSPWALKAVQDAIRKLGYVPNQAARSLVTRRSDTVLLVVSESEDRVFGEPFFGSLVRGLSQELSTTSLQLNLMMASTARQHGRVEQQVRNGHVDGVILISLHGDDPLPQQHRRGRRAGGAERAGRCRTSARRPTSTRTTSPAPARRPSTCTARAADASRRSPARRTWRPASTGSTGYRAALRGKRGVTRLVAQGDFGQASGEAATQ